MLRATVGVSDAVVCGGRSPWGGSTARPTEERSVLLVVPAGRQRRLDLPRVGLVLRVGPDPVPDLGQVVAERTGVLAGTEAFVDHLLTQVGLRAAEGRHVVDDVDDEVEPV